MLDCTTLCVNDGPAGLPVSHAVPADHVQASLALLARAFARHAGRIAVVSSFGAESAVLLALAAEIDPAVPVLFLDTGQHFEATLAYRDEVTRALGLRDVRSIAPSPRALQESDPSAELWQFDPDACCRLRKVAPLEGALRPFQAWVTGRKRHQAPTRSALQLTEQVDGRTKYNPLATWTAAQIEAEMLARDLPRHPLSLAGYPSIGCAPCTRAVAAGQDPRSGRWAGTPKVECGLHTRPAVRA
jgi:phosphoadenosine phosphosulfate reductase